MATMLEKDDGGQMVSMRMDGPGFFGQDFGGANHYLMWTFQAGSHDDPAVGGARYVGPGLAICAGPDADGYKAAAERDIQVLQEAIAVLAEFRAAWGAHEAGPSVRTHQRLNQADIAISANVVAAIAVRYAG